MDQPESYLDKLKKAKERASQAAPQAQPPVGGQPAAPSRSQADLLREKRMKAEAVDKFMGEMRAQEAAKAPPQPSMAKATGSGAQQLALSVPGMFGDIPMGVTSAVTAVPTYGIPYAFEKAGYPLSEERKKGLEGARETVLGAVSKIAPPTTEEYMKAAEPYAQKIFGVGPMYEPKTPQEAIAQTAIGVGGTALMGRPTGMLRRGATGVIGAGTSEAAGQLVESTDYANAAPYVRFGTLVASPYAFEKFPMPQASTIAGGFATPTSAARKNIAEGVESFGSKSEVMSRRMARGKNVSDVAAKMPDRIREFNQDITGIIPNSAEYADLLERVGKVERDRVFGIARANPNSNAIDVSGMGNLQSHPLFKEAEAAARQNAVNAPTYDIIPPSVSGGQTKTNIGVGGAQYQTQTPQTFTPGNLNYYQQVKEELDVMIKKANANGDYTRARGARQLKDELINAIDPQVPEYRDALSTSRLTYGMENAPEAGAAFAGRYKTFSDYEFKKSFDNYTPEEADAFRVGFLGRLEESLINGEQGAFNLFIKNPAFQKKVEHVFGPEIAGEIRAKYLSEAMLQRAAKIDQAASSAETVSAFEKSKRLLSGPGIMAAVTYTAADLANQAFLVNLLKQSGVGLVPSTIAAVSALATLGGKIVLNASEKRIANKMVELISKNDPADYTKINRLIDKHPDVYPKVMTLLEAARTSTELYGMPKEERPAALPPETLDQTYDRLVKEGKIQPQRANGGRVARASGGKVEILRGVRALMQAAENAKKSISKSTETLLDQPDEHIAQALHVAKKNI
jgi:hypothetical protein